jgi:UDPglucose 6-dehydrogenase
VQALLRTAHGAGLPMRILDAVEAVNITQKLVLGEKILARFGEQLEGRTIAVWGLAFKPNTDDMRQATSLSLLHQLLGAGAQVAVYDPVAQQAARAALAADPAFDPAQLQRVRYATSPMDALIGADALAIVTEWKQFRSPDFGQIRRLLRHPIVFDGRNLFDPSTMLEAGIEYHSIGRSLQTLAAAAPPTRAAAAV